MWSVTDFLGWLVYDCPHLFSTVAVRSAIVQIISRAETSLALTIHNSTWKSLTRSSRSPAPVNRLPEFINHLVTPENPLPHPRARSLRSLLAPVLTSLPRAFAGCSDTRNCFDTVPRSPLPSWRAGSDLGLEDGNFLIASGREIRFHTDRIMVGSAQGQRARRSLNPHLDGSSSLITSTGVGEDDETLP